MTLWQPHCDLRVVRTTAYLKAIMEVYGKTITGLGPVELVDCCTDLVGSFIRGAVRLSIKLAT